jgi:hypothetical protein
VKPPLLVHRQLGARWERPRALRRGAGFISRFRATTSQRTNGPGVYLAREDSYSRYGTFDIRVVGNTVAQANLSGSHDGLLAYADSPAGSHASTTFGTIGHRLERLTIQGNAIHDTAAAPAGRRGFNPLALALVSRSVRKFRRRRA